jgi:hypothetical protein
MSRHSLLDELDRTGGRRIWDGDLVTFENGRFWRRGFNHATLVNPDVPFYVTIGDDFTPVDATHSFETRFC